MSVVSTDYRVFKPAELESASSIRQSLQAALRYLSRYGIALLLPAALLALWQVAVNNRWLPEQILPAPALVWQTLQELWHSGELQTHLQISASRVGWSVLIGTSIGLSLGFAMGLSRTTKAYVSPTFEVVSQFPVLGWIPILIIFAGIDETLKISAISIAVVVPMAVNTQRGIGNIPRAWFEVARVYGFTWPQMIGRVVLPAAAPSLFTGLRQAVMQAWLTLVFVELLASSEGIGYLMVWGRQLAQLDLVIVGMLVIGLVGVTLDAVLRRIESRVLRWRLSAF